MSDSDSDLDLDTLLDTNGDGIVDEAELRAGAMNGAAAAAAADGDGYLNVLPDSDSELTGGFDPQTAALDTNGDGIVDEADRTVEEGTEAVTEAAKGEKEEEEKKGEEKKEEEKKEEEKVNKVDQLLEIAGDEDGDPEEDNSNTGGVADGDAGSADGVEGGPPDAGAATASNASHSDLLKKRASVKKTASATAEVVAAQFVPAVATVATSKEGATAEANVGGRSEKKSSSGTEPMVALLDKEEKVVRVISHREFQKFLMMRQNVDDEQLSKFNAYFDEIDDDANENDSEATSCCQGERCMSLKHTLSPGRLIQEYPLVFSTVNAIVYYGDFGP